ncbi:hypothetical protein NK6_609 [Bradyrhizobium diazoefficiens]|uniref:Uncharacterized protein n=1 Tax=Bradyrhizobium diazoefficiens TaxID=1355477 RepID=A0A0E4BKH1_9BRAD|nr:hypothetical protein NK6_609 [Bradyrhizobium diazoefficiens]
MASVATEFTTGSGSSIIVEDFVETAGCGPGRAGPARRR